MTHTEILAKAINKAIAGGWLKGEDMDLDSYLHNLHQAMQSDMWAGVENVVIFNHDFAKALWGLDRLVCDSCHVDAGPGDTECWNCNCKTFEYVAYQNTEDNLPNWQYQLQQMVIAEDPIVYLGENI